MMKPRLWCGAFVCVVGLVGAARSQPEGNRPALVSSLPLASELPDRYRPVRTLGDRDDLYAAGTSEHRVDDGDTHHGLPATVAWAANPKDEAARTQGLHYRVRDGRVIAAGYVLRQADLVTGRSFYGLTLRELDFPGAHHLTIELLADDPAESARYLFLWDFLPGPEQTHPMLSRRELQDVARLPPAFGVVRNAAHVNDFYPRMGRHRRNLSEPVNRLPAATGVESVWYGEAAGTLIFIEYILSQRDLSEGAFWLSLPLNGVPIPPIDNVHILHYNGAEPESPGRYTVHMYFVPETQYLSWETEPGVVSRNR